MHVAVDLVVLVSVVTAVGGLGRRWDLPAPLLLVVVGIAGSYLPRYEGFELEPEVVLVGLLPPLLYAAAIRTSLFDFRQQLRPILSLSVALVVVTTGAVGLVVWWLLPIDLAPALAIGAVVAPPDAVAATAIARRVGLPRRLVTILEGESLVNDATALVCLNAAIAGIIGSITVGEVARDFALSAVGGIAVGLLVAMVVGRIRLRVDDTLTDTAIALTTPFVSYVLAEEVHGSGVLAVVVTGMLLGHKSAVLQSARARLFERGNWATIQFLLENAVFLLIGLQVRTVLEGVGHSELTGARIAAVTIASVAVVILVRPLHVAATFRIIYRGKLMAGKAAVLSWAGMRGVVTLAAAFALPEQTSHREVLLLIAFVITATTLLLQGFTLPWLIRRTGLAAPDPAEDVLQEALVVQQASRAGLAALDDADTSTVPDDVLERLRRRMDDRSNAVWERLGGTAETPTEAYRRLRVEMLRAERAEVLRIRDQGDVAHEVLQDVLNAFDVEESILDAGRSTDTTDREEDLTPTAGALCHHLADASAPPRPTSADGCEECLRDGTTWVHLRLCMRCGHVGCCDSSPQRHASAHFGETEHPVIRSLEPGEAWRWCFVDEQLG